MTIPILLTVFALIYTHKTYRMNIENNRLERQSRASLIIPDEKYGKILVGRSGASGGETWEKPGEVIINLRNRGFNPCSDVKINGLQYIVSNIVDNKYETYPLFKNDNMTFRNPQPRDHLIEVRLRHYHRRSSTKIEFFAVFLSYNDMLLNNKHYSMYRYENLENELCEVSCDNLTLVENFDKECERAFKEFCRHN